MIIQKELFLSSLAYCFEYFSRETSFARQKLIKIMDNKTEVLEESKCSQNFIAELK